MTATFLTHYFSLFKDNTEIKKHLESLKGGKEPAIIAEKIRTALTNGIDQNLPKIAE
jgi:hypothetical protein